MLHMRKVLTAALLSSCIIATGCQKEEASKPQVTPKQEQTKENKEQSTKTTEGNAPLTVNEPQPQLGNESFTNMTLEQLVVDDIRLVEIDKSLLVLYKTSTPNRDKGKYDLKSYKSLYSNGKWQFKDKEVSATDMCENPNAVEIGIGTISFQCKEGTKEATRLFFNDKGEVSFKENVQLEKAELSYNSLEFKSSLVKTDKGPMILTNTGKETATLTSLKDGKEIEKIETPGFSTTNGDFINTTKKEIISNKEVYDYKKKDYAWGKDGQKLELKFKGRLIGIDKNKNYYSFDNTSQRINIEGGAKKNYEVMQTKGGENDTPTFSKFTGYYNKDDQEIYNISGDEIHYYGYYLYKGKPSIFNQIFSFKASK
ncbi:MULTISPECIES: hypothetical protein [Bacillus cereus group]|nr:MULTISPECIES: hypothetical protein [Bacillus cereus group]MDG1620978.1 hypothetical protein [Bacillus mobilis]MDX5838222.1 hypothetical protein [Bacillus cereus group sp. BfR-BA-01700]OJE34179.1 hypothetical protein BAQ44_20315 [Bacillus mobilis]HDR7244010.1 hypothetical protein [Bacillus mobilis]